METPISDDLTLHQTGERRTAALQRALATAIFGTAAAGIVIACLTLRLNPQIHARPADAFLMIAYLCVGYAVIGLVVGLAAGLVAQIILAATRQTRLAGVGRKMESAMLGVLGLGPLLYAASLPDLDLAGRALTNLIFSPGLAGKLTTLGAVTLALGAAGFPSPKMWALRACISGAWSLRCVGTGIRLRLVRCTTGHRRRGLARDRRR